MVHEEKPKRMRKKSHSTEGMKEKLSREFAERAFAENIWLYLFGDLISKF
jgi:hypothetical protein